MIVLACGTTATNSVAPEDDDVSTDTESDSTDVDSDGDDDDNDNDDDNNDNNNDNDNNDNDDNDDNDNNDNDDNDNDDEDLDDLTCKFEVTEEDAQSFKGKITIGNANTEYVYNGYCFDIWSVEFSTTSKILTAETVQQSPVEFSQTDKGVLFKADWFLSVFPLGLLRPINITATKSGDIVYPTRCVPHYVRGDMVYPVYLDLPDTWEKQKPDLKPEDLINGPTAYYEEKAAPVTDTIIMHNPPNQTQIQLGQAPKVNYPVNDHDNLRIWMTRKLMALALGFVYEWFKINPNYMCALGTKENFACGLIPVEEGSSGVEQFTIDGQQWDWYISIGNPDGPFQQETGNFMDMAVIFPDYFPDGANHDDYVTVALDASDPQWITSAISSALSLTTTRENIAASPKIDYNGFMENAADPWAECALLTYAYNIGLSTLCEKKLFSDNLQQALASADIAKDFDLVGDSDHVATVRAVVDAMNKATEDLYDAELTMADLELFFDTLRTYFYSRGVPDDAQWALMLKDIKSAFDVLAAHWGGGHISYRYDFLTILRVAKKYLPMPTTPRPTQQYWYDIIETFAC